MSTSVTVEQLHALIYGACFLASGGGGPISMARTFLAQISKPLPMVDLHELASLSAMDGKALVLADMGSPDKVSPTHGMSSPVNAFHAMSTYLQQSGAGKVALLLPIELGAVNSLIPFYVSSQLESPVPVLNADPSGRSVPQLNETLLDASGQSICPALVTSDSSTDGAYVTQIFLNMDAARLEEQSRAAVTGSIFGEVAGLACYPLDVSWLASRDGAEAWVPGSLHAAMLVGDLLQVTAAPAALTGLLDTLKIANYVLFEGALTSIRNSTAGGFDVGKLILTAVNGDEFWVYYKNESLLAWDPVNQVAKVIAPDCINLQLTTTGEYGNAGEPLSTADVAEGMPLRVWGTACFDKMRSRHMVDLFMQNINEILRAYPDDGLQVNGYISVETLNG